MDFSLYVRLTCLLVALGPGADVMAADGVPPLVASVFDGPPAEAEQRCGYTRTRIDGGRSKSERYHPETPDRPWTLELVNGQPPSEAELRRFARDAGDHDRRHPLAFDLDDLVVPGSWRLRREDDREAVFEFRLRGTEDIPARVADKALGTLIVDRVRMLPRRVTIANTEPAYVAPFVRVAEYSQQLTFQWDDGLNTAVLAEIETYLRGRAFGLKALRKHEVVRYSDYVCRPLKSGQTAG